MEIGLIYSSKDPQQLAARDFIKKFVEEHGVLAHIVESEEEVVSPRITINGCDLLGGTGQKPVRNKRPIQIPSFDEIGNALERTIWSL